jgi:hypothetical protein
MEVKKLNLFGVINNIYKGCQGPHLLKGVEADSSNTPTAPDCPSKVYAPFMINRALSQHQDTTFHANEMNIHYHLPVRMQYDFLRHGVRPRSRYGKWAKSNKKTKDIEILITHYGYTRQKAEDVIDLLTKSQLKQLKQLHDEGGK